MLYGCSYCRCLPWRPSSHSYIPVEVHKHSVFTSGADVDPKSHNNGGVDCAAEDVASDEGFSLLFQVTPTNLHATSVGRWFLMCKTFTNTSGQSTSVKCLAVIIVVQCSVMPNRLVSTCWKCTEMISAKVVGCPWWSPWWSQWSVGAGPPPHAPPLHLKLNSCINIPWRARTSLSRLYSNICLVSSCLCLVNLSESLVPNTCYHLYVF